MSIFDKPARAALCLFLAGLLALLPFQPSSVYADDTVSITIEEQQGGNKTDKTAETPKQLTNSADVADPGLDGAINDEELLPYNDTSSPEQDTGSDIPQTILLEPSDLSQGDEYPTTEEGADASSAFEEITTLSNEVNASSTYDAAYTIIKNASDIIPWDGLTIIDTASAAEDYTESVFLEDISSQLADEGVDIADIGVAVTEQNFVAAQEPSSTYPSGVNGWFKASFKGNDSLPEFSIEKDFTLLSPSNSGPIGENRAFTITGGEEGIDYEYPQEVADDALCRTLLIKSSVSLTISMAEDVTTSTDDNIVIKEGTEASIYLRGIDIDFSNREAPAVALESRASATIGFFNNVSLTGGYKHAGIEVPPGATATFNTSGTGGSVTVQGGAGGAGIGGAFGAACGTMNFKALSILSGMKFVARGGERVMYFNRSDKDEMFGGAGIGGGACINDEAIPQPCFGEAAGNINISAGNISAYGGWRAAGIGGGAYHAPNIHIDGGVFPEVVGGVFGAGIGGGAAASGGVITIEGTATFSNIQGGRHSAGIGSSTFADTAHYAGASDELDGGLISIRGTSSIKTTGGSSGAGIGGGVQSPAGDITIEGYALVDATAGANAAAIGSGVNANEDLGRSSIKIGDNAQVNTVGNAGGAGIGGGYGTSAGTIIIDGFAQATAIGGVQAAAIGSGVLAVDNAASSITLGGNASVNAEGAQYAAGIGGGAASSSGTILTYGNCTINAKGGQSAAAIGGGSSIQVGQTVLHGNADNLVFGGGTMNLTPGINATAAGTGEYGISCNIQSKNTLFKLKNTSGWKAERMAFFGTGAIIVAQTASRESSLQPASQGSQSISMENSIIEVSTDPAHGTLSAILGGAQYTGDISIKSGTFIFNKKTVADTPVYLAQTTKDGGIIIDGGAFNGEGEGELTSVAPVNSQGQSLSTVKLNFEELNQTAKISTGSAGAYDFSGMQTDAQGSTTMLLPPSDTATPASNIISATTEDGTRYQNSFVREAGQTYEKTLYKNGMTVSFDLAGGTGEAPNQNALPGDVVSEPTTVTRDGFKLTGWTKDGQPYDFTQRLTEDDVKKTMTLVATWEVLPEPAPKPTPEDPSSDTPAADENTNQAKADNAAKKAGTSKTKIPGTGDTSLPFMVGGIFLLALAVALTTRLWMYRRDIK